LGNAKKNFDILAASLSVLHNYIDRSTKLFSDLYPAKILDFSQNRSFCVIYNFILFLLHIYIKIFKNLSANLIYK